MSEISFKLKTVSTKARKARGASEKAEKTMKRKLPTAEEILRDMPEPLTDWKDRPATPGGGDRYQGSLFRELRTDDKFRPIDDNVATLRLEINTLVYDEAGYENPGTPETPGKYVKEEWNNRTHFHEPQPTNFYTERPSVPMEWKTKVGVDASGWDVYSDSPPALNAHDAKLGVLGAKPAPALKGKTKVGVDPEGWTIYVDTEDRNSDRRSADTKTMNSGATTQCSIGATRNSNHAFYKSNSIVQTPIWPPFSAQAGFGMEVTGSAETRDTVATGRFTHLAGVPKGVEIDFDISPPGFQKTAQAAGSAIMTKAEAEAIVAKEADKIAEQMTNVGTRAVEEDTKANRKRILMLMKEQKERERKEAEVARLKAEEGAKKAAEELRRLEEELAGL